MKKISHLTMMEVIAIMTVIIVMITIFMPLIAKSREWAKSIACKNNLKSNSAALLSYANDNKGILPVEAYYWFGYMFGGVQAPLISTASDKKVLITKNLGYLPVPKIMRAPSGLLWIYCYPIDYSGPYSCPSQAIEYRNQYLYSQVGSGNSTVPVNGWYGSHYGTGDLSNTNIFTKNSSPQIAFIGDSFTPGTIGGAFMYDQFIYGRHFGLPIFYQSTFTARTGNKTFEEHGSGSANWAKLDGHVESWTWRQYYNRYGSSNPMF